MSSQFTSGHPMPSPSGATNASATPVLPTNVARDQPLWEVMPALAWRHDWECWAREGSAIAVTRSHRWALVSCLSGQRRALIDIFIIKVDFSQSIYKYFTMFQNVSAVHINGHLADRGALPSIAHDTSNTWRSDAHGYSLPFRCLMLPAMTSRTSLKLRTLKTDEDWRQTQRECAAIMTKLKRYVLCSKVRGYLTYRHDDPSHLITHHCRESIYRPF